MIRETIVICSSIIVIVIFAISMVYINNTNKTIDPPNFVKKTQYINRLTRLNNQYLKDLPCTDKICNRYCKKDICEDHQLQLDKYERCLQCNKKNLCLADDDRSCKKCKYNEDSCEKRYGCYDKYNKKYTGPFNPGKNECIKCWN